MNGTDEVLERIQSKVLWLAVNIVHHANNVRPTQDGLKVGGHQASSASLATVMTSLYFDFMHAGDRVSVKPHASPVFHAIQYLLGNLDRKYLGTLREYKGLQAYPSRTKDPDDVDFSTGSVGLGAVAPNFASLVDRYTRTHSDLKGWRRGANEPGRYISLVGDAELDEGSVWEAIAEPAMAGLDNVIWVIDLNRQSLDRIIPGIRVGAWGNMFAANGWTVVNAKYGSRLEAAYAMPNGELLRDAIDGMSNELYQRLLRVPPDELRDWLPRTSKHSSDFRDFLSQWDDPGLQSLVRNLGGHDFTTLRQALATADAAPGPAVVFAYTLKGWMLPSVGDPQNHSVMLNNEQMTQLREELDVGDDEWPVIPPESPEGALRDRARVKLNRATATPVPELPVVPTGFGRSYSGSMSSQQIFGLVLTEISRGVDGITDRVVTVSPDVASSTNLGGWINKAGVWAERDHGPLPDDVQRALRWEETPHGQHIELGISENNLFMMLGQLGLSHETLGETLFPIGTLYDPFIRRGLDALFYSVYAGGRFIFVGTPSGITLGPEGGAHQSVNTPAIGIGLPEVAYYEPCFGVEVEWILMHALEQVRRRTESTYLRLTTLKVDQGLLRLPTDPDDVETLRRGVIEGAYRLIDRSGLAGYDPAENVVHVFACGAVLPEAIKASESLLREGVHANVINVTGPGPLYKKYQAMVTASARGEHDKDNDRFWNELVAPSERTAPIVTVLDGHPQALAWLGGVLNGRAYPLGVTGFGQSGGPSDLYREYGIDADSIAAACFGALEN
jgi:pyruvate dehydrogenase E1 component